MQVEAFDSLVQFLVDSVSPDNTLSFCPTPIAQERLNALARIVLQGALTPAQQKGIERVVDLERLMQLAKARRLCQKRLNVPSTASIYGVSILPRATHRAPNPSSTASMYAASNLQYSSPLCGYCLMHAIDTYFALRKERIVAAQHGGMSTFDNMAYVCVECRLRRGTACEARTASGKIVPLFNPRLQRWGAHFRIEDGSLEPLTRVGEVTANQLDLNATTRIEVRRTLARQKLYPRR